MPAGFYTLVDDDITVTAQMHVYVNGAEWQVPHDWVLHLALEGNHVRVTVEREGKFMPLSEAVLLKGVLTTSSRPELRRAMR